MTHVTALDKKSRWERPPEQRPVGAPSSPLSTRGLDDFAYCEDFADAIGEGGRALAAASEQGRSRMTAAVLNGTCLNLNVAETAVCLASWQAKNAILATGC